MEDGLNKFDNRLSSMEASQTSLARENNTLREKVAYLENYTRRQNTRIVGIPENAEGPQPTEFITKVLIDVLGEDSFERLLAVDRAQKSAGGENRLRPFIVRIHHFQTKELILHLARQKGPLSYNGSRFNIFPDCSPDVNIWCTAFSESKKKLHATKIQFGLYYPATLQFTHNRKRIKFTTKRRRWPTLTTLLLLMTDTPPHAAENGGWGNVNDRVNDANNHLKETVISFDMVILSYFLTVFSLVYSIILLALFMWQWTFHVWRCMCTSHATLHMYALLNFYFHVFYFPFRSVFPLLREGRGWC